MLKSKGTTEKFIFIIEVLIIVAIFATLFISFKNFSVDASDKGAQQLERSIRRSVMACYAAEGVYPTDISYLVDHYGLQIDDSRFIVRYDIFAENIMPDITVIKNK